MNQRAGRRWTAGLLTVAVLLATIGFLLFRSDSDDTPSNASRVAPDGGPSPTDEIPFPPVTKRATRRQVEAFGVLRTPPEGLPAGTIDASRPIAFGVNPYLAQRLRTATRATYWLVPGNGFLCIAVIERPQESPGTSCATTGQALANGVAITLGDRADAGRTVVGVAPDGTQRVRLVTSGAVVTAPVAGNVFSVTDRASRPPDRIVLLRHG